MWVLCDKGCGLRYDDARSWTICPHNPLDGPPESRDANPEAGYCREHDLFGCPLHDDSPHPTDVYGVTDTRRVLGLEVVEDPTMPPGAFRLTDTP